MLCPLGQVLLIFWLCVTGMVFVLWLLYLGLQMIISSKKNLKVTVGCCVLNNSFGHFYDMCSINCKRPHGVHFLANGLHGKQLITLLLFCGYAVIFLVIGFKV